MIHEEEELCDWNQQLTGLIASRSSANPKRMLKGKRVRTTIVKTERSNPASRLIRS